MDLLKKKKKKKTTSSQKKNWPRLVQNEGRWHGMTSVQLQILTALRLGSRQAPKPHVGQPHMMDFLPFATPFVATQHDSFKLDQNMNEKKTLKICRFYDRHEMLPFF